jgi:hypothetical protein
MHAHTLFTNLAKNFHRNVYLADGSAINGCENKVGPKLDHRRKGRWKRGVEKFLIVDLEKRFFTWSGAMLL